MFAQVAVPPLARSLTYLTQGGDNLTVGMEVEVPLGTRSASGFIVEISATAPDATDKRYEFKHISSLIGEAFHPKQLPFLTTIANYYQEPLSRVLETAIPARFIPKRIKKEAETGQIAPDWAKKDVTLNAQQKSAYDQIFKAKGFNTFLLHGVTGSGKTEIYIEAVKKVLATGKQALVIVPEIALTPQLIDRFRARIQEPFAVLHSGIGKRQRWEAWLKTLRGEYNLAIGARSAIFAPLHDLGIIIVDEEHDESFKQSDGFRYQARDCAVMLGKINNCPVVLGSATPSLESYYNAHLKRYHYLPLTGRTTSYTTATVEVVDLNKIPLKKMISSTISPQLFERLKQTVEKNEQAFILYNRRGFASYFQCERCNTSLTCPHCSVTLTYYQKRNLCLCHFCNYTRAPETYCPSCSSDNAVPAKLQQRGAGTEKVYDELLSLFPNTTIERLDRDAARDEEDFRAILDRVRSTETQILVGTKMIAKGHDLPGVTLVGIVDSDIGIHLPDFRASEKAFQLLLQVSGRAGRADIPGQVVIQTRLPKHPSIQATVSRSYKSFATTEINQRKALNYPPFSRLLRIVASSTDQQKPQKHLNAIKELFGNKLDGAQFLGPAPCPFNKLKDQWRWHLIIRSTTIRSLHVIMANTKPEAAKIKGVKFTYDLDPQEML